MTNSMVKGVVASNNNYCTACFVKIVISRMINKEKSDSVSIKGFGVTAGQTEVALSKCHLI